MSEVGAKQDAGPGPLGRLQDVLSKRLVLVTGKGGVGKTTIAAAIAKVAAAAGKKVLVAEMASEEGQPGPLHELIGGAGKRPTVEPQSLAPGIDGVLLTPTAGHRAFLRDVLPLGLLADRALKTDVLRRFLSAAPAFAELGVLYRGLALVREQRWGKPAWDLVIVDSPATGHALAFTSLPEVALKIIPGGPIGRALREGHAMLVDPKVTAAVVATLPEALPVAEALELVAGLERSRIHVAGIIANQVPDDPFSADERAALSKWLDASDLPDDHLGTRSLDRLTRAGSALQRLGSAVGAALVTVEESAHRGTQLLDRVAHELTGAIVHGHDDSRRPRTASTGAA